jgi:hypothetical protein
MELEQFRQEVERLRASRQREVLCRSPRNCERSRCATWRKPCSYVDAVRNSKSRTTQIRDHLIFQLSALA